MGGIVKIKNATFEFATGDGLVTVKVAKARRAKLKPTLRVHGGDDGV